jgi:hypothetical protein
MADTDYYLQRAKREAVLAIQADCAAAAASHQGLSVRYSARAALEILDDHDTAREKARHQQLRVALAQV